MRDTQLLSRTKSAFEPYLNMARSSTHLATTQMGNGEYTKPFWIQPKKLINILVFSLRKLVLC